MLYSVVPEERGRNKFKVVYVVLESQYQASLTAACTRINDKQEGVSIFGESVWAHGRICIGRPGPSVSCSVGGGWGACTGRMAYMMG